MNIFNKKLNAILFGVITIVSMRLDAFEYPDDVAFCIADTKFDGKNLKILEFGDSAMSMFKGHDALYGRGSVWSEFWKYLKQFDAPIWFVGYHSKSLGVDVLERLNGTCVPSGSRLRGSLDADYLSKKLRKVKEYKGIVFVKTPFQGASVKLVMQKYPSILFVNQTVRNFVINKYRTDLLFHGDKELQPFRPRCKVCTKRYNPNLAKSIIQELKGHVYVIKPTSGSRGRGVIFVTKDDLDATLQVLFNDRVALRKMCKEQPHSYGFWLLDKSKNFLVEKYAPSKPITVAGKEYDATMRLVFTIHRIQDKVEAKVHCAYWKLPAKAISEKGSLTEKHRSDIHSSAPVSSVKVSPEDFKAVSEIFCPMMENVYRKMMLKLLSEKSALAEKHRGLLST